MMVFDKIDAEGVVCLKIIEGFTSTDTLNKVCKVCLIDLSNHFLEKNSKKPC